MPKSHQNHWYHHLSVIFLMVLFIVKWSLSLISFFFFWFLYLYYFFYFIFKLYIIVLVFVNIPTKTSHSQKQTSCSNFYHQGPCLVLACWGLSNICCVKKWHNACYLQGEIWFFWKPNLFIFFFWAKLVINCTSGNSGADVMATS